MLIELTANHLRHGRPGKSCDCAIALAMREAGYTFPVCGYKTIWWGLCSNRQEVDTPGPVESLMRRVDGKQRGNVKPCTFKIEGAVS